MLIKSIRTLWKEDPGFSLNRPDIGEQYIFLHYLTPVKILVKGEMVSAAPGSCILYNKHTHQKFTPDNCTLSHDWCHITGNLDKIVSKYGFLYNTIYMVHDSRAITKLMQEIELEFLLCRPYGQEIIQLKFEEIVLSILRDTSQTESTSPFLRKWTKEFVDARARILHTSSEPWDVPKMAALVNLCPSRFHKLYTSIFGISPQADLIRMRLEHAELLLLQNQFQIQEVAEMAGYNNPYHFIRAFKKKNGMTPGQFVSASQKGLKI